MCVGFKLIVVFWLWPLVNSAFYVERVTNARGHRWSIIEYRSQISFKSFSPFSAGWILHTLYPTCPLEDQWKITWREKAREKPKPRCKQQNEWTLRWRTRKFRKKKNHDRQRLIDIYNKTSEKGHANLKRTIIF